MRPESHKRSEQRSDENSGKFEEYCLKGKRKKSLVLCEKKMTVTFNMTVTCVNILRNERTFWPGQEHLFYSGYVTRYSCRKVLPIMQPGSINEKERTEFTPFGMD